MLVVAGTLDLYGNEGDYFLMLLTPYLTSTLSTVCCLDTCPLKQHTVKSMSIVLPQPADTMDRRNIFSKSLDDWQHPQHSNCGRKFSSKPSDETLFNEDVTLGRIALEPDKSKIVYFMSKICQRLTCPNAIAYFRVSQIFRRTAKLQRLRCPAPRQDKWIKQPRIQ